MDTATVAIFLVPLLVAGGGGYLMYDHYRTVADSRPVDGVVVESNWGSSPEGGASLIWSTGTPSTANSTPTPTSVPVSATRDATAIRGASSRSTPKIRMEPSTWTPTTPPSRSSSRTAT